MSAVSSELAPNERGLVALLRNSLSRDEFFAGLFILGCVNGLVGRSIYSLSLQGLPGFVTGLEMNLIVLFACFVGISLVLSEQKQKLQLGDILVGFLFLILVSLPIFPVSWVAITGLSLYILLFTNAAPDRKRGALVLLTLTMPMLWSRLVFQYFANFLLDLDARFVSSLMGTNRFGNTVGFADGSGMMIITPACNSFSNISMALLCWVTITQWVKHRWSPTDLVWCFMACVSVVAINVVRIAITGQSRANYELIHNEWGEMVLGTIMTIFIIGFSVLGARRELFARV